MYYVPCLLLKVEERESAVQLKSTEEIKQLKEDFNRVKHELEASLNEKVSKFIHWL